MECPRPAQLRGRPERLPWHGRTRQLHPALRPLAAHPRASGAECGRISGRNLEPEHLRGALHRGLIQLRRAQVGSQARTDLQRFDRQLLAAWLAVANGSIGYDQMVDTDGNGTLDKKMGQWLNELETARNGTPSDANLKLWAGQLENLLR